MKTLLLVFTTFCISVTSLSQSKNGKLFISIWNTYRLSNDLSKVYCDGQHTKTVKLSPNKIFHVMSINKNGDTSYHDAVASGSIKIIPKYHDKNTSLIFSESFTFKNSIGESIYFDSLCISDIFTKLIQSNDYSGILLSNRKFYIDVITSITDDFSKTKYSISLYEVLDIDNKTITEDYGCIIFKDDYSKYSKISVDPKNKKNLSPNSK